MSKTNNKTIIIALIQGCIYLNNLSQSNQSTAGLKALKPAANGRYLDCYIIYAYCTEVHLSFCSNEKIDIFKEDREIVDF